MDILARLHFFDATDAIALVTLAAAWIGIGLAVEHGVAGKPSVSVLMIRYRREWMQTFVTRQPRIFDANILSSLRHGTTFFASACLIAIGGGLALIGNTERLLGLAEAFSLMDINRIWCQPDNAFLHGHVLWHLIGSLGVGAASLHFMQFRLDEADLA